MTCQSKQREFPKIQTLVYRLEKFLMNDGLRKADAKLVCCFICTEKQLKENKELGKEKESLVFKM